MRCARHQGAWKRAVCLARPVCRFRMSTKGTGPRPLADCACRSCRRPVGRASASSFSFRGSCARQSRYRGSCGRMIRTAAAVSSVSSATECLVGCDVGHHDQREGCAQPQEADRSRIAEGFAQALPEDELRKRQRKDDCKNDNGHDLTMRRSRRDGRSSRLKCDCKNLRAPDRSTRWMTMRSGRVGSCRVPVIPGLKESGAQAPVLRRPARNAERVRILGMTSSVSAARGSLSRLWPASEGPV